MASNLTEEKENNDSNLFCRHINHGAGKTNYCF